MFFGPPIHPLTECLYKAPRAPFPLVFFLALAKATSLCVPVLFAISTMENVDYLKCDWEQSSGDWVDQDPGHQRSQSRNSIHQYPSQSLASVSMAFLAEQRPLQGEGGHRRLMEVPDETHSFYPLCLHTKLVQRAEETRQGSISTTEGSSNQIPQY